MNKKSLIDHPPNRVKKTRDGVIMYNIHDKYVGRSFDIYGEFSELECALFRQIMKPGMTALDIGANIGAHTVPMAKLVGSNGSIIAFEPQRLMFQMLCGNVALNGLTNVQTFMQAVGKEAGTVEVPSLAFDVPNNFGGMSLLSNIEPGFRHESVPIIALDQLNCPRCDFMKIDVEGMEQLVLEGAAMTLLRCQPLLYVENDRQDKSEQLIHHLLDAGYRLYWHLPPLFNPQNFFECSENIFPDIVSNNMLGIPRSATSYALTDFLEITHENAAQHPGAQ